MPASTLEVPRAINRIVESPSVNPASSQPVLEFATTNEKKLTEIREIMTGFTIIGRNLNVEEIQKTDPIKVAEEKAKAAWLNNDCKPIIIEETSFDIASWGGRPGVYAKDFIGDVEARQFIMKGMKGVKDRRAIARTILGIWDGREFQYREGIVEGKLSKKLRGNHTFGFDDMIIPNEQSQKKGFIKRLFSRKKTFGEMTSEEKNSLSMRRQALEKLKANPFKYGNTVLEMPEPYKEELSVIRKQELYDTERIARPYEDVKKEKERQLEINAANFAYKLLAFEGVNKPNETLTAPEYKPVVKQRGKRITRYTTSPESKSIGLLYTHIDRDRVETLPNGEPIIYEMGPGKRERTIAQRIDFFKRHQAEEVFEAIAEINKAIKENDTEKLPHRANRRIAAIEELLVRDDKDRPTKSVAFSDVGYRKLSTNEVVSRDKSAEARLLTKVGKYARRMVGVGSLPPASGQRDVVVTAAVAHMISFIPRNSLLVDYTRRKEYVQEVMQTIESLGLGDEPTKIAKRNVGVAIGTNDPLKEAQYAAELFHEANVTAFRIYTINGDARVIETAREIRKLLGNKVEIFVGQVTDKAQALELVEGLVEEGKDEKIAVDGLIYGHGAGRQCTSAENGMAITQVEDVVDVIEDSRFNNTSVLVEGGVGPHISTPLAVGVDCVLYNNQFVHGTHEAGELFFKDLESGDYCTPYPGSASVENMYYEAEYPEQEKKHFSAAGKAKKVEGKPGYMFHEGKGTTMTFYVDQFLEYVGREFADLGVKNFAEFRELLQNPEIDIFRQTSDTIKDLSKAYRRKRR